MTERVFFYEHDGYRIQATIWNEANNPQILFDFNNVLNAYTQNELLKASKIENMPYAIVSLLMTTGDNFKSLKEQAYRTGECIVALTAKLKGNRKQHETGLKYAVMKKLGWNKVLYAFDDKPHEWMHPRQIDIGRQDNATVLDLDPKKKPVYLITF